MLCEFSTGAAFYFPIFIFIFFFAKCATLGASPPQSEPPAYEAGDAEEDFQQTFAARV